MGSFYEDYFYLLIYNELPLCKLILQSPLKQWRVQNTYLDLSLLSTQF